MRGGCSQQLKSFYELFQNFTSSRRRTGTRFRGGIGSRELGKGYCWPTTDGNVILGIVHDICSNFKLCRSSKAALSDTQLPRCVLGLF
jgi:hypothetical protein